ncbi:MAG TPA: hypothetical protein VK968_14640, partial [Roseimicrobium sp.]|nr:hypothetical protein [Roseimicrobium sp.]
GLPSTSDDIYALGVILYELLTSTPPFQREALLERDPSAKPTPIADRLRELKIENDVPNEEAAMVMACLSKEPSKRPASARAVAEWVGIEIRRRPKPSIAAPEVKEFTPVQAGPDGPTAEVGEAFGQYKLRRNFLKIGLAVAGVGIASLATGYWWVQHTKTASDTSNAAPIPETNVVAKTSASSDAVDTSFDAGIGVKGDIRALLVLADGSVLLSGFAVRQEDGKGLSVMHFGPRGTPDSSFAPRIKGNVNAMAQQPDGKLLIAGDFSAIDGEPCNSIARLFPNGKRDSSFNPGEGGDSEILCLSLQPDGKILIGGNFTKFNRLKRVRYARLNADGSVDEGFNPRTVEAPVWTIVAQPDGKILVGGNFTKLGSIPHTRLVRLHPDSSIDGAFGVTPDDMIRRVVVLPSGKILVGGNFTRFQNQARAGLVRLNPNGKLDGSFPPLGDPAAKVRDILVQEDQSIIITGNFSLPSSKGPLNKIARLRKDGILDETLDWGATINGVYQAALTPS